VGPSMIRAACWIGFAYMAICTLIVSVLLLATVW